MEQCKIERYMDLDLNEIKIPDYHPRQTRKGMGIEELARSQSDYGNLVPLLVRSDDAGGFILVTGERRLEAAKKAGLTKITCALIKTESPCFVSLIENMQREDLDCLDRADAYPRCMQERNLSQKEFAEKIGKSAASVSATLSLRNLPPEIAARHRNDGILSERQLLNINAMGSLEDKNAAYEKAINQKLRKNSSKRSPMAEVIKNKAVALKQTAEKIEYSQINPAELADICSVVLSTVGRITTSAALQGFDPGSVITPLRQFIMILAQMCGDQRALRAFSKEVEEIARSVNKTYRTKFNVLTFWKRNRSNLFSKLSVLIE